MATIIFLAGLTAFIYFCFTVNAYLGIAVLFGYFVLLSMTLAND